MDQHGLDDKFQQLKILFFCGQIPASKLLRESRIDFSSGENEPVRFQEELLNCTIDDPSLKGYLPANEYIRMFLKSVVKEVESKNLELYDRLLELYGFYVSQSILDSYGYRTYFWENHALHILESTSLISRGTTGLKTWPAAFHLFEWFTVNPDVLKGSNVIELGSGVGFLGSALLKHNFQLSSYAFSDCHPAVLSLLEHNFLVNHPQELNPSRKNGTSCGECFSPAVTSNECENESVNCKCATLRKAGEWCEREDFWTENSDVCYSSGGSKVTILKIDWTNLLYRQFEDLQAEILVATDVVYDVTIIAPFLRVVTFFMDISVKEVFVCCVVRNEDTLKTFLERIGQCGLAYEELAPRKHPIFHYETSQRFVIIKITR